MIRSFVVSVALMMPLALSAAEFSGNIAVEGQIFPQTANSAEQLDRNVTVSFQPKYRFDWNNRDDEFTVELFMRADNKDDHRQHVDIRELKWLHVDGANEWRVGINTVFWGVTESLHLVDVINQIDQLEGVDGEDKLGQPMIQYSSIRDWGNLHLFVLPGFREPEYRSINGRLRTPLPVDSDRSSYQSSDKDSHVDYAIRYSHYLGDTEIAFSVFDGTSREAIFIQDLTANVLIPFYPQMTQYGIDMLSIIGDWTWKLEAIHRSLDSGSFNALTAGFEYTFYGVFDSSVDMGTLLEYSHDTRDDQVIFDNDLFGGLRFAFNDVQSTEILAGVITDLSKQSLSLRVEASRRLGASWKLNAELQVFSNVDNSDRLLAFANDDYLQLELAWYF